MQVSIVHILLMEKFLNNCDSEKPINKNKLTKNFCRDFRLNIKNMSSVIQELEKFGFIERINKQKIQIKKVEYQKYLAFENQ